MSISVAALVAAAAFTLTYLFCVRAMMHGSGKGEEGASAVDAEVAGLRKELRALRAHDSSRRGPPEG